MYGIMVIIAILVFGGGSEGQIGLEGLTSYHTSNQQKYEDIQHTLKFLLEESKMFKNEVKNMKTDQQAKIEEMQMETKSMKGTIVSKQQIIQDQKAAMKMMQEETKSIKRTMVSLQQQIQDQQNEMKDMKQTMEDQQTTIKNMQDDLREGIMSFQQKLYFGLFVIIMYFIITKTNIIASSKNKMRVM